MDLRTALSILDIKHGASKAEIEAAFRRKSRGFHPDLNSECASSNDDFHKLNEAKAVALKMTPNDVTHMARENLKKEEEMETEAAPKRNVAIFHKLTREEMLEGGSYELVAKIRETCFECHGKMIRATAKDFSECFICHGKGDITASRGKVSKCALCDGTGIALTEKNTCLRCHGVGKIVMRKRIICRVPAKCSDGQLVGVSENEEYKLSIIIKEKEENECEEPAEKRLKRN